MSCKILNGEEIKNIKPITNKKLKYIFNYDIMKQYSFKNRKELPSDAIIINHPSILKKFLQKLKQQ